MRLTVDTALCQGHTRCAVYAPELIELDDDGRARITVAYPAPAQHDAARRAQQACPERAIIIEEEEGEQQ